MNLKATDYKYIELNDVGVPFITGTTLKVIELVEVKLAYGWSSEEIYLNHRYLTMSQILSALAYYWDYKVEMDAEIQRRDHYVQQAQKLTSESPFVTRLKAEGILSRC